MYKVSYFWITTKRNFGTRIWIVYFFLWNAFISWTLFSWNNWSILIFPLTIITLRLAIRTITIKHFPATSNCNILTQIIDNLLERNTMRLLQYGDGIAHMNNFERIEQTLISLLKTRDYMIINIKAVRIESHKQSLQIVWKYSKKWQRNGDLNQIWPGVWPYMGSRLEGLTRLFVSILTTCSNCSVLLYMSTSSI